MLSETPEEQVTYAIEELAVQVEALDFDEVLEIMRGHWDCLEAALEEDENVRALELALAYEPLSDRAA